MRRPAFQHLRRSLSRVLAPAGYDLVARPELLSDLDRADAGVYDRVRPYTMTSFERVAALCSAVRHVIARGIPGAFVECGVWRGGSMMAVAETLLAHSVADRDLYLFDTFSGMPPPGAVDVRYTGEPASEVLEQPAERDRVLAVASLAEVRRNVLGVGYESSRVHFVPGRVEDTIPAHAPQTIALLRLDTDWYESTRHELTHLYPRLSRGGILLVDDYGCWLGARQATDEYLAEQGLPLFLHRVDSTARLAVRP